MKIVEEHIFALETLGYTEEESRFLYIVATHSGYFVPRQFAAFDAPSQEKGSPPFTRDSKSAAMPPGASTRTWAASTISLQEPSIA